MKILVAYDGSDSAESALDDLIKAGLPDQAEVAVISVAEEWLAATTANETGDGGRETKTRIDALNADEGAIAEAETLAQHARNRLRRNFPNWEISIAACCGSPAVEILNKAEAIGADLIVVGSHGRSTVGRMFLGSISQKIITEARCSVRVSRGRIEVDPFPVRIIIGFDGSPGAQAAVNAVAERGWRRQSEVRLVTATNPLVPTTVGRFVPPVTSWVKEENQTERNLIENLAENALIKLNAAGLTATLDITDGNPRHVLVEESERWHADSVFVGANAHSNIERFLIGSVSAAVAARARCSVEVVRKNVAEQSS